MDINKEREAFLKWHYQAYLLENPEIDVKNAQYIYDYAHKNALCAQLRESHFTVWQAAKEQAESALLEQFEINNKLVEQIEKLKDQAKDTERLNFLLAGEHIRTVVKRDIENDDYEVVGSHYLFTELYWIDGFDYYENTSAHSERDAIDKAMIEALEQAKA